METTEEGDPLPELVTEATNVVLGENVTAALRETVPQAVRKGDRVELWVSEAGLLRVEQLVADGVACELCEGTRPEAEGVGLDDLVGKAGEGVAVVVAAPPKLGVVVIVPRMLGVGVELAVCVNTAAVGVSKAEMVATLESEAPTEAVPPPRPEVHEELPEALSATVILALGLAWPLALAAALPEAAALPLEVGGSTVALGAVGVIEGTALAENAALAVEVGVVHGVGEEESEGREVGERNAEAVTGAERVPAVPAELDGVEVSVGACTVEEGE